MVKSKDVGDLSTPLKQRIGDKTATLFAKGLGVETVGDLLRHYPRRYALRGALTDVSKLRVGDDVTVIARVQRVSKRRPNRPGRGRPLEILEVEVGDGASSFLLTFFNQGWRDKELLVGRRALFAGKVGEFKGKRQLAHPDYEILDDDADDADDAADANGGGAAADAAEFARALIPVYPATEKLRSWTIARSVRVVLDVLEAVDDPLPDDIRARYHLLPLDEALRLVHQPHSRADVDRAIQRLKFDEAFVLQVALAQRRHAARAQPTPPRQRRAGGVADAFDARLPFELTAGQREVAQAVDEDLAARRPMHRLLQGEVGSGKTVVALRAMLAVVDSGGQAALLVPTAVLAMQHARNLADLLGPVGRAGELDGTEQATRLALLTGSTTGAARRDLLAGLASGEVGIIIGTHALLEPDVVFRDLGLVVVDEQHRFGVHQRDTLRAKGVQPPHLLVMTATPIPRTVAMTVYGDLETSTLRELPGGRAPTATHVVPVLEKPAYLERAWAKVREEVAAGHQAFVVCPRIGGLIGEGGPADDDEREPPRLYLVPDLDETRRELTAAVELFPVLRDGELSGLRVELLHGRMTPDAKDAVMRAYARGDVDVLVATTVVEVGVDVANATVMVIMDADRFGISQLHQLRGRVGRGAAAATCLLVTEAPRSTAARERLDAVADTLDGFVLAHLDLRQRREGDVLGTSQSGMRSRLRLLELLSDEELIGLARDSATELVAADPDLTRHPALARELASELDEERAEYLEKA